MLVCVLSKCTQTWTQKVRRHEPQCLSAEFLKVHRHEPSICIDMVIGVCRHESNVCLRTFGKYIDMNLKVRRHETECTQTWTSMLVCVLLKCTQTWTEKST